MTAASPLSIEALADEMFTLVTECTGKRKLKAGDLTKAMIAKHGETACDKEACRKAIRVLIDSGRCISPTLEAPILSCHLRPTESQRPNMSTP